MSPTLDPQLKRALAERIRYYNDLGIYDFYRREITIQIQPEEREPLPRAKAAVATPIPELVEVSTHPESGLADPAQGLLAIREDIGDCTRCRLAKQGRKQIVFGVATRGLTLRRPSLDDVFLGLTGHAAEEEEPGGRRRGRRGGRRGKDMERTGS